MKAYEKNINAVRFLPFLQNMRFKIIAKSLRINCRSPEFDSQPGCYWEHQEVWNTVPDICFKIIEGREQVRGYQWNKTGYRWLRILLNFLLLDSSLLNVESQNPLYKWHYSYFTRKLRPEGFENQHSGKNEHKEPAQITSSHCQWGVLSTPSIAI